MDTMTNAEVFGKTMATLNCPLYNEIGQQWSVAMHSSVLRIIPIPMETLSNISITGVALFFYLLSGVQFGYGLWNSTPWPWWKNNGVSYEMGLGDQFKFEYATIMNEHSNNGIAALSAAEATRMEAVLYQEWKYRKARMKYWRKNQDEAGQWMCRYLRHVQAAVSRGIARFALLGVLQNCLQANLQLTLVALTISAQGAMDYQMVFSVVVTASASAFDIPDAYDIVKLSNTALNEVDKAAIDDLRDEQVKKECRDIRRKILWRRNRLAFYMMFWVFCLLYALAKIVALFACPGALFNFPGGCVPGLNRAAEGQTPEQGSS